MSQLWSEINKVVNVMDPASNSGTTGATNDTDIVHLENYKKLTYIIHTGASVGNTPQVTVYGGETSTGATAAIAFKYKTQISGTGGASATTGSDIPSALATATSTGFAMTTAKAGGLYIVDVDVPTVAVADTTDQTYDHVKLRLTNSSTAAAHIYGVVAILSEPRYPQAVLQTAID